MKSSIRSLDTVGELMTQDTSALAEFVFAGKISVSTRLTAGKAHRYAAGMHTGSIAQKSESKAKPPKLFSAVKHTHPSERVAMSS
jgi:hypothetical protein